MTNNILIAPVFSSPVTAAVNSGRREILTAKQANEVFTYLAPSLTSYSVYNAIERVAGLTPELERDGRSRLVDSFLRRAKRAGAIEFRREIGGGVWQKTGL